jgi:hypothetical protein
MTINSDTMTPSVPLEWQQAVLWVRKKYYVSRTDEPGKGDRLEGVVRFVFVAEESYPDTRLIRGLPDCVRHA